jgi:hypothetical protein
MKYQLLGDSNFQVDPRIELINTARNFYKQGWMPGTTGNLSTCLSDNSFWMGASSFGRNSQITRVNTFNFSTEYGQIKK